MRFKRSASQHARPWYPMGNTIVNGRGRGVCRHPHSYCFDPLPRCRPRSDGAEDAPPGALSSRKCIRDFLKYHHAL